MTDEEALEPPKEGLRERKRRETRKRIAVEAFKLFKERGYNAVTVDQIAEAANVSKRTFFDYFPSKDDVVGTWQDSFVTALADAVSARPAGEPIGTVVEESMIDALMMSIPPDAEFINELIESTPSLRVRNQYKYVELEWALVAALTERFPDKSALKLKVFGMVAVGMLRLGVEEWHARRLAATGDLRRFNAEMYGLLWEEIDEARTVGER